MLTTQRYKLLIDLPFLKKGSIFEFEVETGKIYANRFTGFEYPLREGLSSYLWLLRTERKYLRELTSG